MTVERLNRRRFSTAPTIHAPAANTAAVATIAAIAGRRHILSTVEYSYTATPTNGSIKIAYTLGGVAYTRELSVAFGGEKQWNCNVVADVNTQIVCTLAAGGAGVTGKIVAIHHNEAS